MWVRRARLVLSGILVCALLIACTGDDDQPAATPTVTPEPGECTPTPVPSPSPTAVPPTATQSPTQEPTATPVPPTTVPGEGMMGLQRRMQAAADAYPEEGRYSAAVTDLQTGETILVNGDNVQVSGCVMNLFVLILAMRDVERGAEIGAVSEFIDATIWSSNATTARALYEIAGGGDTVAGVRRVGELLAEIGMPDTVIDHPPGYPEQSLGVSSDNWITARDVNRALAALYHGEILGEPYRTDLLDRLVNVKPGLNYLTAYGTGGVVSHKNGFFPMSDGTYVDNDAGIVRFYRGGVEYAYAISFFSDFVPYKYGDIALGQEFSRLAWAYFDTTYR